MSGIDPYLCERSMEQKVHEMQQEAEVDRLQKASNDAHQGRLVEIGRKMLNESGRALSALGAWLEQQGEAGKAPFDGSLRPSG